MLRGVDGGDCEGERDDFYVTLFSNSGRVEYPDNTLGRFTSPLARTIALCSGANWKVGLVEFSYAQELKPGIMRPYEIVPTRQAFIYCDLISPQFVGVEHVRCLRTVLVANKRREWIFDPVQYVPVEKRRFGTIRIEILTSVGTPYIFNDADQPTKLVLHFRRV